MKTYKLNNEKVMVLSELKTKDEKQIVDKEGSWVRIEFLSGPNKGNKKPIVVEKLEKI